MYKFIGLAFSLKGQDFSQIAPVIDKIEHDADMINEKLVVCHGFMPRDVVIEKGFNTQVCDKLIDAFPRRLNFYRQGNVLRRDMAEFLKEQNGEVFVIGEVKEGVAEEVVLYEELGVPVRILPLHSVSS